MRKSSANDLSGSDAARRGRMRRAFLGGTAVLALGLALVGAAVWLLVTGNVILSLFIAVFGLFFLIGESVELEDMNKEYKAVYGSDIWRNDHV